MYTLDKRIEELEFEIAALELLKSNIEDRMQEAIDTAIDAFRMVIDEQIETLTDDVTSEIDLSRFDSMIESDLMDELREDFVDRLRMEF